MGVRFPGRRVPSAQGQTIIMPPRSPVVPPIDCPPIDCPPIGTLDWKNLKEFIEVVPLEATEVSDGLYESGPFASESNAFGVDSGLGVALGESLICRFEPVDLAAFVAQIQYGIYGPAGWTIYNDDTSVLREYFFMPPDYIALSSQSIIQAYPKDGGVTSPVQFRVFAAVFVPPETP